MEVGAAVASHCTKEQVFRALSAASFLAAFELAYRVEAGQDPDSVRGACPGRRRPIRQFQSTRMSFDDNVDRLSDLSPTAQVPIVCQDKMKIWREIEREQHWR